MYEGRGMKAVVARLALLAVPALLTRVDFAATRSSPQTGAAHPEAGSCRTLGTANKQAVPHRRATPVYSAGEKCLSAICWKSPEWWIRSTSTPTWRPLPKAHSTTPFE